MRTPARSPLLLLLPLLAVMPLVGCTTPDTPQPVAEQIVERVEWNGWEAIRLDDGRCEVVVVPEVGRMMSLRLRNQDNVLYMNPKNVGKSGDALVMEPSRIPNIGGDKVWPWPQSAWGWPPPQVFEHGQYTGRITADGEALLESDVDESTGLRVVRTYSLLDGDVPGVRVTSQFEAASDDASEAGLWTVTQVLDPLSVVVFEPYGDPLMHRPMSDGAGDDDLVRTGESVAEVLLPEEGSIKLGFSADTIAAIVDGNLLVMRQTDETEGVWEEAPERTQIWTAPPTETGTGRIVELELTSPIGDESASTIEYRLQRWPRNLVPRGDTVAERASALLE